MKETEHGTRIQDVEFIWARTSEEFLFANSVLIHGENPVLIDPSASFTYIEQLSQAHYVRTIVNTHYHLDHRTLNHLFKDVVFASHEADADAISDFDYYTRTAIGDANSYYLQWVQDIFKRYKIVDCPVALRLKDGDIIDTGSECIRVISIPGHTPGHIALFFEKANALFTADMDLTPYGPWYANLGSDLEAFRQSVERLKSFECEFYVPGHGERMFDRPKFLEKMERYSGYFDQRDNKIIELLKNRPMELDELSSHGIVYKSSALLDPLKCYFQFQMVKKHVDILIRDNVLRKDGEKLVVC